MGTSSPPEGLQHQERRRGDNFANSSPLPKQLSSTPFHPKPASCLLPQRHPGAPQSPGLGGVQRPLAAAETGGAVSAPRVPRGKKVLTPAWDTAPNLPPGLTQGKWELRSPDRVTLPPPGRSDTTWLLVPEWAEGLPPSPGAKRELRRGCAPGLHAPLPGLPGAGQKKMHWTTQLLGGNPGFTPAGPASSPGSQRAPHPGAEPGTYPAGSRRGRRRSAARPPRRRRTFALGGGGAGRARSGSGSPRCGRSPGSRSRRRTGSSRSRRRT